MDPSPARFPEGADDVETGAQAEAAVRALAPATELAVDVEADAMHAFRARLCFVQVGTDEKIFLFDTLVPEVRADALAPLFADPSRTKYFHAAGEDLKYLAEAGVRVRGLFDTHRAATLLGSAKVGLADLARELLGVELLKEHQQSDFSLRPLPAPVRAYIADDVRYLVEIGRRTREACRAADILEEVELDCERLCELARAPAGVVPLKLKLPGALTPEARALAEAIAAELHALRLRVAEAANLPMGQVLSNAAVLAIATRPPSTIKELARAQGVRGAFARAHGEEALAILRAAIDRARRGELVPVERARRDPLIKKREDALKALRQRFCEERKVTPSVVLGNALVDAIAEDPPRDIDGLLRVPFFGEKRARLYGKEILERLATLR